jgi:hypothetical protein
VILHRRNLRTVAGRTALAVTGLAFLVIAFGHGSGRSQALRFTYHEHNAPGMMDQTLEITNAGSSAVVPTLEIVPVDSSGAVLAGIHVSTAYGSDAGRLLAPAQTTSIDVLAFTGGDASKVADVRVNVRASDKVEFPVAPQGVVVQAVDAAGQPTSKYEPFSAVKLTNPNRQKVAAGVVCILWDQPPDGQSQQASEVVPLGVATIAGNGSATVRAAGGAVDGCGSLKAYFTPLDQA